MQSLHCLVELFGVQADPYLTFFLTETIDDIHSVGSVTGIMMFSAVSLSNST